MYDTATGLVPVFRKDLGQHDVLLYRIDSSDITLNVFAKTLFESNDSSWHWKNATNEDLCRYIIHTLGSFCEDHEKITRTQEMIYVLMHEKDFANFLIRGSLKFENFYHIKDFTYRMSKSYVDFVIELGKQFKLLSEEVQQVLKPFTDFYANLIKSESFIQIKEFSELFLKPMRFTGYIGKHPEFRHGIDKLVPDTLYSKDSKTLVEASESKFILHDISCVILNEGNEVSCDSIQILDDLKRFRRESWFFSHQKIAEILGITVEELAYKVIPNSDECLKVIIEISRVKNGFDVSVMLNEPPAEHGLVFRYKGQSFPKYLELEKKSPITLLRQKPLVRTSLQTKLLGKTKTGFIKDPDGFSSVVYELKTDYFYPSFFRKVQNDKAEFGKFLIELRYLAFISEYFCLMARISSVVFPEIIPKEENRAELVEAKNPVLITQKGVEERKIIANDILISTESRVQMITGPNQNGKSRYIDSIALNQIFAQAGWPVFAKKAIMSPKTDLKIHYVHSGVGIPGESRFSHECARMRKVFEEFTGKYPLIIIDEPFTGTNYGDELKLLQELLSACSQKDITIFLTTHCHGLIHFMDEMVNGRNLHCHVDKNGGFTFQIKEGGSTKSNALDVAEKAGIRFEQLIQLLEDKENPPPPEEEENDNPTGNKNDNEVAEDDLPF